MKTKNRILAVAMLLAGGTGAAAALAAPAPGRAAQAPQTVEVKIDNFSFSPSEITVTKGTPINWVNRDDIPHTVVSDDKTTFKSKPLDTDDHFSFTFSKEGTYPYFCSIHPKMTAKVIVK